MTRLARTYGPKIRRFLRDVAEQCRESGLIVDGPYERTDDEYAWCIVVKANDATDPDDEEGIIDVTITIIESEVRDGEKGGCAFSVDIVRADGEMLGGLCPYNYSPDLYVKRSDRAAVEGRWAIIAQDENIGETAYIVSEALAVRP
jgi:hypothetical protein